MISNHNSRLAIIVPAYNEAETIGEVLNQIKHLGILIVVDDGSTDGTALIAQENGARVVKHSSNQGYEKALWSGFECAQALGCSFVIFFDGDGQHDAKMIPEFENYLLQGFDLVLGVRDHFQRVGESIFSIVSNLLWNIKDPLCGLKGFSVEALYNIKPLHDFDSIGTAYAIDLVRKKKSMHQVRISTSRRRGNSRMGSSWSVNLKILAALYRVLLRSTINKN